MITATLVVLLYGILLQQKCLADVNYGYILNNTENIPCTTDPYPRGLCRFNHEVAIVNQYSPLDNGTRQITQTIANLQQKIERLERNSSDAPCLKAKVEYYCKMMFPINCTDKYLLDDKIGLENSCKKVSKYCVNETAMMESCKATINKNMPTASTEPIKRQRVPCELFSNIKNDQLRCEKRNYKVVSANIGEIIKNQVQLYEMLETHKTNINQECFNTVSELICQVMISACDINETVALSFVGRQECKSIISCLNFALGREFQNVCRPLPNEDAARRIPLSSVYIDIEDDIPKIPTTKINMTPTTRTLIQNKTTQTQKRNPSDPNSPTERPHLYSTGHKTTPKAATKPKIITTTQAMITKLNESSALAEVKSDPSLKSTTEKPTTHSTYQAKIVPTQQAKITKPNKSSKTPTSSVTHENMADVKSDPSLKPKTERPRTHSMNQTKSVPTQQTMIIKPNKSSKTPTFSATYENIADVKSDSSIKPTTERPTNGSTTNSTNQAAQSNTRSNRVALSVISMLYVFMWH